MRYLSWLTFLAAIASLASSLDAIAQAPINSNVALQPSKGGLIIRQQLRYTQGDRSTPTGTLDLEQTTSITTLVYGISDKLTLIIDTPFVLSRRLQRNATGQDDTDSGLADMRVLSKIRLYRNDFGPNDTTRVDFLGGFVAPTGRDEFSQDTINPVIGGVITHVEGRHSFDADAVWTFDTDSGNQSKDLLQYDLAYIYRLQPETYAAQNPTALFASIELNGLYETNGDDEIFLSPGIQYVTTRWIIEGTIQLPVLQDLDNRIERDVIVGIGFRVQF